MFSLFFSLVGHAVEPMVPFRYAPHSISQTRLSGIDLSKGVNVGVVAEVGSILSGNLSSVPLNFVINLSAINPNVKKVTLTEFEYILKVDHVDFARGQVKKKYKFAPSSSGMVSIPVYLNLTTLLRSEKSATVQNMVKNFMGTGNRPTQITLYLKPVYQVGKETVIPTQHIPVIFTFQGNR
ncbi:MAG: hypothetical protein LUG51_17175 [Tannerellaceae bacterium]|nr:hypothetical protein [Tannerellaceae bacterium]